MAFIDDGFPTTITFTEGVSGTTLTTIMREKEVTPPSMEAGGPNDTTTMRNTLYRTRYPKNLITLGNASLTVSYDADLYNEVVDMIGENQEITITFPDATTLVFWGWLDTFTPGAIIEGEQATAEVVIVCSNVDGSNAEIAPVHS